MNHYKVNPGKTWGSAPSSVKRGWFVHQCSKPSKQNNLQCVAKDMPAPEAAAKVLNPEHVAKPRCDRSWCAHHRTKHNIKPGRGWGTAPPKVRHRFYFKRACLYPAKQNNLGCAKEASALATGDQLIPAKPNCDSEWCQYVTNEMKVKPGSSWGTANKKTQKGWFTHKCSAPKEQNHSGCPGGKKFLGVGLPAPKKYDANAGIMGGSGRI